MSRPTRLDLTEKRRTVLGRAIAREMHRLRRAEHAADEEGMALAVSLARDEIDTLLGIARALGINAEPVPF